METKTAEQWAAKAGRLEAQRDELLSALDGLLFAVYEPRMRKEALDIARAAIAKARATGEGEK